MSQVIISFLGICTYIRRDAAPDYAPASIAGRRWVLVNGNAATIADNPNLNRRTPSIDAHFAKLQVMQWQATIDGPAPFVAFGDTWVLDLDGYTLEIVNQATGPIDDSELICMPSLRAQAPNIGPVGPAVLAPTADLTSCIFDFNSGRLQGSQLGQDGAGVTLLTIDTEFPDADPVLKITPFASPDSPTLVTLHNDRTTLPPGINVMNFPFGEGKVDDSSDFYLHYLTASTFPADATVHRTPLTCPINPFTYNIPGSPQEAAGPECSNSGYP